MKMKESKNFKRTAIIVACFVAVLGISIGGTYALLTSQTKGLKNDFTVGSVETEIDEPGMELKDDTTVIKKPAVRNVGKNSCYIRARIDISPVNEGITIGSIGENWVQDGEYYYYTEEVAPGASTSEIFTEVKLPGGWISNGKATSEFKDFDVIVYQEAVQANLSGETDYGKIWQAYGLSN